jgi:pyruvate formate lyase activating enzyme
LALKNNLPSISYTYTEPTVFLEYALDTMKLARKKGLKNVWVTNGFLSKESLELIAPYLDAANVDLKSFSNDFYRRYCGGRLQPILNTLKLMKKSKIWVEITTLLIPSLNDSEKNFRDTALFIKNELGPETPWHISRFCGTASWKLQDLPDTPLPTLALAHQIGIETGLKYVYCGNVPGIESENTFCPRCRERMISRIGYSVKRADNKGKCSKCGEGLNIIE